ncbi:hypothetical protein [Flexibacterium corallicola]|uniref:hypothetical protein n=1 Tax=Flexibacterium corallicola TaxID=3037259 RepID=UPI00286F077F|nr:hypothetical protein [Pseudovibrio sp. M1P-2-3]
MIIAQLAPFTSNNSRTTSTRIAPPRSVVTPNIQAPQAPDLRQDSLKSAIGTLPPTPLLGTLPLPGQPDFGSAPPIVGLQIPQAPTPGGIPYGNTLTGGGIGTGVNSSAGDIR